VIVDREHGHTLRVVRRTHSLSVAPADRRPQWSVPANAVGGAHHRWPAR